MSKNIFDYATKELSQDAFLRWLFENYNDDVVGPASREFMGKIAELCHVKDDGKPLLDPSKITRVETWSQYKRIDIIADIYTDDGKFEIVIEDKTGSREHNNQLDDYNESINTWDINNKYLDIYKIYYKTGYLEEYELKRIGDAEWKLFDHSMIKGVFEKYENSQDVILSSYAKHVVSRINQVDFVPTTPMNEWNPEERASFFRVKVAKSLKERFGDRIECYTQIYQGRYSSLMIYYGEQLDKKYRPIIEFFFRKDSPITANIHVETAGKDDKWLVENMDESFKEKLLESLTSGNDRTFVKWNKKKCIAKMSEKIEKTNPDEVSQKICECVRLFVDRVSKIN